MKNASVILVLILILAGCVSAPLPAPAPVAKSAPVPEKAVEPATVDFDDLWIGVVRIKKESNNDNAAVAVFNSEWTLGENAGNVYPKKFVVSGTDKEVPMDFMWDSGGKIDPGVYDVYVDVDGLPGEGWIRNLKLDGKTAYEVYISFKAARFHISLNDGDDVYVYPAGSYAKYEGLGRLDSIPEEILISSFSAYTENRDMYFLIPAVPVDLRFKHTNGEIEWFKDYTPVPESFINKLP